MHKCILFKIIYLLLSTRTQSFDINQINQGEVFVLVSKCITIDTVRIYALQERHFWTVRASSRAEVAIS